MGGGLSEGDLLNPGLLTREGGGDFHLRGSRCRHCGRYFFPSKEVCPSCFDKSAEECALSGRGTLVSWSVSHQASALGLAVPYVFGYVDLEEGPRIYGLIDAQGGSVDDLEKGMALSMEVAFLYKDITGKDLYTYKFRPAGGEDT